MRGLASQCFTHFSDTAIWCCPGSGLFVMRSSRTPRSKLASCWEILEKVRFSENWYSFQTASEAPEVGSCFRPDPRTDGSTFGAAVSNFKHFKSFPQLMSRAGFYMFYGAHQFGSTDRSWNPCDLQGSGADWPLWPCHQVNGRRKMMGSYRSTGMWQLSGQVHFMQ